MIWLLFEMLLALGGVAALPAHPVVAASTLDMRAARLLFVDWHSAFDVRTGSCVELHV